jgi:hypothetical protein
MGEGCACGGSCGPEKKGPNKALKYALMGFVVLSLAAAVHKIAGAPRCAANEAAAIPGEAAGQPAAGKPAVNAPVPAERKAAAVKTAVVYYFYTNTRCSSCKTIEEYTKAAVAGGFASDYKGWRVAFKGVNIEEEPNGHFKQDYWLNSKSVVVQKFSGDKALKWVKLEQVWQLLGDKDAFMHYVTAETHKLLDEK